MKPNPKLIAPLAVLGGAALVAAVMVFARGSVEQVRRERATPVVGVNIVRSAPATLRVTAHGTVAPRTESDLVAEVAGRVIWVSPKLASGGFFSEREVLARIDPRDYEMTLEAARAGLARSESDWTHARSMLVRQRSMRNTGASSRARLDDAIHNEAVAAAGVREARVAVARAELDLARSEVTAPFDGRVRDKHIDVGQFIIRGAPVARVYAVDYAEVRLSVSSEDAAFLELPLGYGDAPGPEAAEPPAPEPPVAQGPEVVLSARFAGQLHTWRARIVRTEGALDPRTRMITAVARVEDPYNRVHESGRAPLPVGLFVEAEIRGREVAQAFELPRAALREREGAVVVVDAEGRLELRPVDVLRVERERVWVRSGLRAGERVVNTSLDVFVEGMLVRVVGDDPAVEPSTAAAVSAGDAGS